jgi:scyllo-inositol 2-dehydrogenase (NADP+)
MRAVLRASMHAAGSAPTFLVRGTKGSFIKYGQDPQEAALKAGQTPDAPDWDLESPEMYGRLTTPEGTRAVPTIPSTFTQYYANIRDAILGKAALAVTPEWSLDVMRGLLLAVQSSEQRCVLPWGSR